MTATAADAISARRVDASTVASPMERDPDSAVLAPLLAEAIGGDGAATGSPPGSF